MILVDNPRECLVSSAARIILCYDLDGSFARRLTPEPRINGHEALKRDELGLVEVRSHVWRDVIS